MLGLPTRSLPLQAETRSEVQLNDIVMEKWVYTSETGSRISAILYRPAKQRVATPGVALTFGHGGSKSPSCCQHIGQLYGKLSITCLAADPIREEERHRVAVQFLRANVQ